MNTGKPTKPHYRPEIDGLRALAVLAVVIFHADFLVNGHTVLSGGFIGVDIFFVISGFLITALILRSLQESRFNLLYFFERRARRILPALFVVLACSLPFAWKILLPDAMVEYAGANVSTLLFGSNFWFWQEESYFAQPAALKPFLHTWSLAVEEQFYFVLPALLMALWAFGRRHIVAVLSGIAVLSLIGAHYMSARAPDVVFYLLPFRGWELLAGSILAAFEFKRGRAESVGIATLLPSLGLVMILISFVFFNARTAHPSAITLLPVVGTLLVLRYAAPREPVSRFLSTAPCVGVGLISYSLYLWHFVVFAFARIYYGETLSYGFLAALIALSFGLAILTYFFIEQPGRNNKTITGPVFITVILAAFVSLLGVNTALYMQKGVPSRMGAAADLIDSAKRTLIKQEGRYCIGRSADETCFFPVDGAKDTLIIIGDSHAEAISNALLKSARGNSVNVWLFLEAGCPLIPKTIREEHKIGKQNKCLNKIDDLKLLLQEHPKVTLLYFSYMAHYLGHDAFMSEDGAPVPERSASVITKASTVDNDMSVSENARGMFNTWLHSGHKLIVIDPVPEARVDVPKAFKAHFANSEFVSPKGMRDADFSAPLYDHKQRTARVRSLYDSIETAPGLYRFDPADIFCSKATQRCMVHDGALLYSDTNHLSPHGAEKLVVNLESLLGWE